MAREAHFVLVDCLAERLDELRRKKRINSIAVAPQESHSTGYPISQRECAGFNAPRFPVCAGEYHT